MESADVATGNNEAFPGNKHGMIYTSMASIAAANEITVSEALARREAVSNALTDLRLEGLKPSPAVLTVLRRYAAGGIDEAELLSRVLR